MIYLGLGSNLGDRLANLRRAFEQIVARGVLSNARESVVLETEALLPDGAPRSWNRPYLNVVVSGGSERTPQDILRVAKQIELDLGRPSPHRKWAPRVVDIDILFIDGCKVQQDDLVVPHPRLKERPFFTYLMGHSGTVPSFLAAHVLFPKMLGILNVTPDSFSDGGLYLEPKKAWRRARDLIKHGAVAVDIGAQSTRPGAQELTTEEEWARLEPVLEGLEGVPLSLDSYNPDVILRVMKRHQIAILNDQAGQLDAHFLREVASSGCSIVAMHALSVPVGGGAIPADCDVWQVLDAWATKRVSHLEGCGFDKSRIILDPGIGFGKLFGQTRGILSWVDRLKAHGCPVLIGHSRKSFIAQFHSNPARLASTARKIRDRDVETLSISAHLFGKGVDYLRVHDVSSHRRFFISQKMVGHPWG